MTADLNSLPPAPWQITTDPVSGTSFIPDANGFPMLLPELDDEADLAALRFAALARNAFDVMVRRKWNPSYQGEPNAGWFVCDVYDQPIYPYCEHGTWHDTLLADPFTALVEADAWLTGQGK